MTSGEHGREKIAVCGSFMYNVIIFLHETENDMKKRIQIITALFVAAALAASLAGCGKLPKPGGNTASSAAETPASSESAVEEETGASSAETADSAEETITDSSVEEETGNAEADPGAEEAESTSPEVIAYTYYSSEYDEETSFCYYESRADLLKLSPESAQNYPALAESIDAYTAEAKAGLDKTHDEMSESAEVYSDGTVRYFCNSETALKRADDKVLSFAVLEES